MRRLVIACALLGSLVAGCDERKTAEIAPPPHTMTAAAIGTYCGMSLIEHAGPKGQILLASRPDPLWFSSARDAIAFTLLPEEAKDIRAVYVSDMAKAPSWEHPGPDNWVLAEDAVFVIDRTRVAVWGPKRRCRSRIEPRRRSSPPGAPGA